MRSSAIVAILAIIAAAAGGCTLLVDVGNLAGPTRPTTTTTGDDAGDAGGATSIGGDAASGGDDEAATPRAIGFAGVTSKGFYANDCPCALAAPPITPADSVALLAVSLNAHDEHLPTSVTYDGADLGAPIETIRMPYTRLALWVVPNARSSTFSVAWQGSHGENGVMMAAIYSGVDSTTPSRSPIATTGEDKPARVTVPSTDESDLVVTFFGLNDTSSKAGLNELGLGSGQTFRAQTVNESAESQLGLSDGTKPVHEWAYTSDRPWAVIGLALIRAR